MDKKNYYIEQYKTLRQLNDGKKPLRSEFLRFCKIRDRHLNMVFGQDPYSKLQVECGDSPNKLDLERASITTILNQYGELVRKKGDIPVNGDWLQANYSPQPDGLRKVHNLKWSDMPSFFIQHNEHNVEWKDVINILNRKNIPSSFNKPNRTFHNIVDKLISWTPDRKRIIEEGYKIELRNYLEKYFDVEEEVGESNPDLLIDKKYPIEVKKDPTQSEYDRLLGQMIRHNKLYGNAIAVITSISSEDRFKRFQKLFIEVHTKLDMTAELINK
ncbi:MAG TPA: hypothetical protein VK671_08005 [Mucilaginibacter sp.]|jgi:hypothetical protein|nr:hypothetical protein [Mucilaginibacter sp.]